MKAWTVLTGLAKFAWARCLGRPLWSGVSLLVTLRCNIECPYCDFPRLAGPEMDTSTLLRLLEGLRRWGTFRLGLSGGEPLLRPDFGEIAQAAARLGFVTNLVTNGVLMRERIADLRAVDFVMCTIEGGRAVHDAHRGPGAFEAAVSGLEAAIRGRVTRLGLICPVHSGNIFDVEEPLRLAESLGIRVYFQPVQERTGWTGPRFGGILEPSRQAEVFLKILSWKHQGRPVGNSWAFLRMVSSGLSPTFQAGCPAGRYVVTILPDGRVIPCCIVPFEGGIQIQDPDRPDLIAPSVRRPACEGCTIAPYFENYRLFRPNLLAWLEAAGWLSRGRPRRVKAESRTSLSADLCGGG